MVLDKKPEIMLSKLIRSTLLAPLPQEQEYGTSPNCAGLVISPPPKRLPAIVLVVVDDVPILDAVGLLQVEVADTEVAVDTLYEQDS